MLLLNKIGTLQFEDDIKNIDIASISPSIGDTFDIIDVNGDRYYYNKPKKTLYKAVSYNYDYSEYNWKPIESPVRQVIINTSI